MDFQAFLMFWTIFNEVVLRTTLKIAFSYLLTFHKMLPFTKLVIHPATKLV